MNNLPSDDATRDDFERILEKLGRIVETVVDQDVSDCRITTCLENLEIWDNNNNNNNNNNSNNNNNQRHCLWCYRHDHGHCKSSPGSFDECRLSAG